MVLILMCKSPEDCCCAGAFHEFSRAMSLVVLLVCFFQSMFSSRLISCYGIYSLLVSNRRFVLDSVRNFSMF
jgi:hypothetical protein